MDFITTRLVIFLKFGLVGGLRFPSAFVSNYLNYATSLCINRF